MRSSNSQLVVCSIIALMSASPALAQTRGTVEFGGFARATQFDGAQQGFSNKGIGGGILMGAFVHPLLEFEAEGSYTDGAIKVNGGKYNYTPLYARAMANLPLGNFGAFVFGAGPVRANYGFAYHYGTSGDVGLKIGKGGVMFRVDGVADYLPNGMGKGNSVWNKGLRAGLSFYRTPFRHTVIVQNVVHDTMTTPLASDAERTRLLGVEQQYLALRDSLAMAEKDRASSAPVARNIVQAKVYFDFDKAALTDDARAALDAKIPIFLANPTLTVRIEGNTDERGSDEYNMSLGMRRASSAKNYLIAHGIDSSRIQIISYGEEHPAVDGHDESAWSQNRRDEFSIVMGGDEITMPAK